MLKLSLGLFLALGLGLGAARVHDVSSTDSAADAESPPRAALTAGPQVDPLAEVGGLDQLQVEGVRRGGVRPGGQAQAERLPQVGGEGLQGERL